MEVPCEKKSRAFLSAASFFYIGGLGDYFEDFTDFVVCKYNLSNRAYWQIPEAACC